MTEKEMRKEANKLHDAVLALITSGTGKFEELILQIHGYQREACPVYGAYCGEKRVKSWQDIPALPLGAFRQAEITCFRVQEAERVFHTSGTTGEGYGRHFLRTTALYRAAALEGWKRTDMSELPVLAVIPPPEEAPHSSLSCMAGWLTEDFYWNRREELKKTLEARSEPCVVFGTALALLDVVENMAGERLKLPPGSLVVETGGYKGTQRSLSKAELHSLLGETFGTGGAAIWNEYGMTELSSQFYASGVGTAHRGGPWVRAVVIDPQTGREAEDGETGVLHIFDLANVESCCALQTQDLAVRQGADFLLIGRDPAALPRGCSRRADELLAKR